MCNELTTKDKWETTWAGTQLPAVAKPRYDVQKLLETHLPVTCELSLIEIGCAPGQWMAYFSRRFGYKVSGLEYAELAANTTKQNMAILGIDTKVFVQDFFTFDCDRNKYDIVFSSGFIEHFHDVSAVVQRVCALSQRFVVTIVPNLYGINGFIGKTLHPKVFSEHNPIDVPMLRLLHEKSGMRTLFCNYTGGVQIVRSINLYSFFRKRRNCARLVESPVIAFNRVSMEVSQLLRCTPRSRFLMYVGAKV